MNATAPPAGAADPRRVALLRGALAIVWALLLLAVGGGFSIAAKVLVVAYPAIDIVASLLAARAATGRRRDGLRLNAAIDLAAVVALAIACAASRDAVLIVFGIWAIVSGQLQVRASREGGGASGGRDYGLFSGVLSTVIGAIFVVLGAADRANLRLIAAYMLVGGVLFLLSTATRRGASGG